MSNTEEIEKLKQQLTALEQQVQSLTEDKIELQSQLQHVLAQLKLSRSKRFGKQSEKAPKGTFNEAEQSKPKNPPKHHNKGRKALPEHLEREEVIYEIEKPVCQCCGEGMQACGSEESEQLKIIPAKISVIKHKRTKYVCRHCEQTNTKTSIITAPKPAQPIPQSIASAEALAAVVTAKYCDALPLYRQAEILKRGGLDISRSTLANWCIKSANLAKPVVDLFRRHLIAQSSLCADETRVQVLAEPGKAASTNSYMWVYRNSEYSEQPVVIYDYQPGRGHQYPEAFLKGFSGHLLCDGYAAYGCLENVTLACCWAHVRRYYTDALKAQPKKTGRATVALSYIQKLYAIEQQARKLSPEKRVALRQEKAKPILEKFKRWLDEAQPLVTPKNYIGKAISYTLNRWDELCQYLEHGDLGIDNNVTERDIRPFTTGRKNWMFSQSVNGANASAVLYSLVMTCRANDINPYYYFQHLFEELPKREKGSDLTDLLPWNIEFEVE
ncbi:IS66 family transposase [Thalassomonas viridans]|uniref:IS66 family transposase n=1 Tax=Thalassomonas viridans TaxID=137584 RepID=A0AAE9YYQ3_9GAMM|nr:IS66 family transposase [Thalassomonas viridans]WDE03681.1 IS66 family transposase [Thalassomonas viridans]